MSKTIGIFLDKVFIKWKVLDFNRIMNSKIAVIKLGDGTNPNLTFFKLFQNSSGVFPMGEG